MTDLTYIFMGDVWTIFFLFCSINYDIKLSNFKKIVCIFQKCLVFLFQRGFGLFCAFIHFSCKSCQFHLCMNVHVSVSLRACVALCWASSNCCCCSSSAHIPCCPFFLRWLLSSSNRIPRRSLYLNTTQQQYIKIYHFNHFPHFNIIIFPLLLVELSWFPKSLSFDFFFLFQHWWLLHQDL